MVGGSRRNGEETMQTKGELLTEWQPAYVDSTLYPSSLHYCAALDLYNRMQSNATDG